MCRHGFVLSKPLQDELQVFYPLALTNPPAKLCAARRARPRTAGYDRRLERRFVAANGNQDPLRECRWRTALKESSRPKRALSN